MNRTARVLGLVLLLQGCVMVPRTVVAHDEQCRTQTRHMVLDTVQVGSIGSCSNQGCAVAVAVAGIAALGSVVVSGTIAVAGNVVYWLEKQGRCER
jgi:hypothetical protein